MIVYRIENDKGIGPLHAWNGEGLETRHHYDQWTDQMYNAKQLDMVQGYICVGRPV